RQPAGDPRPAAAQPPQPPLPARPRGGRADGNPRRPVRSLADRDAETPYSWCHMNGAGFLLIIVAFVFLYFVLIRPQKRRQLAAQQLMAGIKEGDEVVTAGGIYGRVTELVGDDDVMLEIAPELRVRVARRAIGGVVPPAEEPSEEDEATL